jgi:TorA maturation chaperone TorD
MDAMLSQPLPDPASPLAPEDEARAGFYGLIANLLAAPPHPFLIGSLGGAEPLEADPEIPEAAALARAWNALRSAAREADPAGLHDEWQALFTGPGRPAVVLHGSWYLTGFLMEKPLAALRDDLAALGLARRDHCGESEDHLAAVCDVMRALLVDVRRSARERQAQQKAFFDRHIRPWASACCAALEAAPAARFYRAVGAFAAAFLALEAHALDIET